MATTTQAHHESEHQQQESSPQKMPLPLPGPGQVSDATQLPVGGEGVKLDRRKCHCYLRFISPPLEIIEAR